MPELERARTMQLYLPDTNVLVTRWLAEVASVELVDLMPYPSKDGPQRLLIRRVTVTRGSVRMRLRCHPRLDYARADPLARSREDGVHFTAKGHAGLRLSGTQRIETAKHSASARLTLHAGEQALFVLSDPDEEARPGDHRPCDQ